MKYKQWLEGDCGCANISPCSHKDVCDCENILLELEKQHVDDLTLQDEIDYVSGVVETISGCTGGSVIVDEELSLTSTNPVQNKVITGALNGKLDSSAYTPTQYTAGEYITIDSANTISTSGLVTVVDNEVPPYYEKYGDEYDRYLPANGVNLPYADALEGTTVRFAGNCGYFTRFDNKVTVIDSEGNTYLETPNTGSTEHITYKLLNEGTGFTHENREVALIPVEGFKIANVDSRSLVDDGSCYSKVMAYGIKYDGGQSADVIKNLEPELANKLDASAYTPTDLSDYYTKEQVDALIPEVPSLSGYALNSELIQYITNLQQQINSLTSAISGCCGESGETQYRWITMTGENDYWCSGTTKYSKEKEQSSTDGIVWSDTGNIRSGNTVLEENCVDCGYIPISGDNKYFATTIMGTTISGACCDPETYTSTCDELDLHEIAANTGQLRTINVGSCTKVMGNGVLAGEYNLTSVVLPSSVTAIKGVMLEGCTAIQRLTINRDTPPIFHQIPQSSGVGLFDASPEMEVIPAGFKIYVPALAVDTFKQAETWSRYASIIEPIA